MVTCVLHGMLCYTNEEKKFLWKFIGVLPPPSMLSTVFQSISVYYRQCTINYAVCPFRNNFANNTEPFGTNNKLNCSRKAFICIHRCLHRSFITTRYDLCCTISSSDRKISMWEGYESSFRGYQRFKLSGRLFFFSILPHSNQEQVQFCIIC